MFAVLLDWLRFALSIVLFFPTGDSRVRPREFPWMTTIIVALNVLAFAAIVYGLPLLVEEEEAQLSLIEQLLMLPSDILAGEGLGALSVITAAFLHSSWDHLLGNMFLLVFFGRALEDLVGPAKLLVFYLACVLGSGLLAVIGRAALPLERGQVPSLGASGAVMGLLAGYLFLYYDERVRTLPMLLGLVPIPIPIRMPATAFFLLIVVRDLIGAYLEQVAQELGFRYSLVGFFAHLGGVATGLVCVLLFIPSALLYYRHNPDTAGL
jgi:membrane associated rhomboid family serine protease